jgi:hypothetical protein
LLCLEVVQVSLILPPIVCFLVFIHLGFEFLHSSGGIALPYPLPLCGELLPSSADLSSYIHKGQLADLRVGAELVSEVDI